MPPLAQPAAPTTTGEGTRILAKPTFVKAPNHGAAGDVQKVALGSPVLSQEELREYNEAGLVRVSQLRFDETAVAALSKLVDQTLAVTEPLGISMPSSPHLTGQTGLPASISLRWLELATTPAIVSAIREVLGTEDVILWGTQLFHKKARTGLEVPWHQDGHYWPIFPRATCTVWLAIDEATVENGAMGFVPGTHASGTILEHVVDNSPGLALSQIVKGVDESSARRNLLKPGEFSLHDILLLHNSVPNNSDSRRAGFVMRFMPASSLFDRDPSKHLEGSNAYQNASYAKRPIFLVSGSARQNSFKVVDLRERAKTGEPLNPRELEAYQNALQGVFSTSEASAESGSTTSSSSGGSSKL